MDSNIIDLYPNSGPRLKPARSNDERALLDRIAQLEAEIESLRARQQMTGRMLLQDEAKELHPSRSVL